MINHLEILKSIFSYLFLIAISLTLGILIERIARKKGDNASLNLFWKLFTGTILSLSVYAIVITKGLTIFLICPVLLFFFVRQILNHSENNTHHRPQEIIFFLCSVVLNYLFFLWTLTSFNNNNVLIVSGDFNIYFRIAQSFNDFGIENANLDPIFKSTYPAPYHYGDIWMYALISKFVSTNPSLVFLVAFAHFSVIFINGIYTYIRNLFAPYIKGSNKYLYLLLFAGLFTGFNAFFPKFILPSAEPYTLSVMNWSKVLVPSSVIVGLLIVAHSRNWWALILLAMLGGLSFINALPAIFMSIFLLLTYNVFKKSISIKQWFVFNAFYVISTVAFVFVLYKIWPQFHNLSATTDTDTLSTLKLMDKGRYLKTAINIFIGGWFQLFVLLPYFILLAVALYVSGKMKNFRQFFSYIDNSFVLLFFIVFSGLFCWALLHNFDVNSVQFFSNVLSPFSATVVSVILIFILCVVNNKWINFFTVVTTAVCIFTHKNDQFFITPYDAQEWVKLKYYLKDKDDNHVFVNLKPMSTYNSFFEKYTIIFIPLTIMSYKWPDYQNISLNAPFIPVNPKSVFLAEETTVVNAAPFMKYYKNKLKENDSDISQISLQFIKDYNVAYISIAKDTTLPIYLRDLVKDSINLEKHNYTIYRIK